MTVMKHDTAWFVNFKTKSSEYKVAAFHCTDVLHIDFLCISAAIYAYKGAFLFLFFKIIIPRHEVL